MFWKRQSLLFYVSYCFRLPCLVYRIILEHSGAQNSHYLMLKEFEVFKFNLVSCHFQNSSSSSSSQHLFHQCERSWVFLQLWASWLYQSYWNGLQGISYTAFSLKMTGLNIFILDIQKIETIVIHPWKFWHLVFLTLGTDYNSCNSAIVFAVFAVVSTLTWEMCDQNRMQEISYCH